MESVLFTKMFRGMDLEDIGSAASELGFDGIDLLIRRGHQVEPDAPDQIAMAVHQLEQHGLTVPMATMDLTDPARFQTEKLFAACADARIRTIRLGYWSYDPKIGYRVILDKARRDLDTLTQLARVAGVKLAIQLHGGTIHGSGSQTAILLQDHDPLVLGAYPDPGNQVVQDGWEDWRFTFDVLKPWLCCVGVKNGFWFPAHLADSGQRHWTSDWAGLSEGMVPWDDIMTFLATTGYDGSLSFHSHYEVPFEHVRQQTGLDLAYIRRQIDAATSQVGAAAAV